MPKPKTAYTCPVCRPQHIGPSYVARDLERLDALRTYVLDYVRGRGEADYADVVADRPSGGSRKNVEAMVKHLLYHDRQLVSGHAEGTHAFGRGRARLRIADGSPWSRVDAEH